VIASARKQIYKRPKYYPILFWTHKYPIFKQCPIFYVLSLEMRKK
jgi:hypothetical protein